jgi:hypothetical protein
MLVITGFFEKGKFVPDVPVLLPEKTKAVIQVENAENKTTNFRTPEERIKIWNEIREEILNCNEELIGDPEPITNFRTPEDIDIL